MKRNNSHPIFYIITTIIVIIFSLLLFFSSKSGTNNINFYIIFAPFFVPLYIINLIFLFYLTIFRKSFRAIIPLFSLLYGFNIVPCYIQWKKADNISNKYYTIQTYNVHHFQHYEYNNTVEHIINSTEGYNSDILCIQEHRNHKNTSIFNKNFPYSCFSDSISREGVAIYSKFPILKSNPIIFKENEHRAIEANISIDSTIVKIICVHLQTTGVSQNKKDIPILSKDISNNILHNTKKRKKQIEIIDSLCQNSKHPVILCGDFNDTPNSYTYRKATKYLQDAFKTSGSGYANSYNSKFNFIRIDYILHSQQIVGHKFQYSQLPWSDHKSAIFSFYF